MVKERSRGGKLGDRPHAAPCLHFDRRSNSFLRQRHGSTRSLYFSVVLLYIDICLFGTHSVVASYKPPMLVTRAQFPVCAAETKLAVTGVCAQAAQRSGEWGW